MRIISISELPTKRFSVSCARATKRKPLYSNLKVRNRHSNGFLYLEKGACRYIWAGGEVCISEKALLYLPFGSEHTMEILSEDTAFTVVDFILKDENEERIIFSQEPMLITNQLGNFCIDCIEKLAINFDKSADNFKNIAYVSLLLSELCSEKNMTKNKIFPAISYINGNLLAPIDGKKLADLCSLSKAQMYRLFKNETGVTPTEYRNRIRIEKACEMLATKEYYVYEIAMKLGFDNIGYFDKVFKEQVGISPTEYLGK